MIVHSARKITQRPSCILLDMDNTLYAYDPAHEAGLLAASQYAETQINLMKKDFHSCFTDARTEVKSRLGKTAASHNRLLYFQRTIELAGLASQVHAALNMEQAYWRAFLDRAILFDEAMDFLDDLRIAGVPVVIVTDLTAQIQFRKITFWQLNRFVDWVVTSEEVGADKPAPALFELALAKTGGVEGDVWMIGDSHECDIVGARDAVDAITFQKRHHGVKVALTDDRADYVFDHFGQIRRFLAMLD